MKVGDFVNLASDGQLLMIFDLAESEVIYSGNVKNCDTFFFRKEVTSWDVQENRALCLNIN
jgi:hypothetical protein